jgi:hypothetical protein
MPAVLIPRRCRGCRRQLEGQLGWRCLDCILTRLYAIQRKDTPMPDFPILDAPRPIADSELNRDVLREFGNMCAYIEEIDYYAELPVRVVYDQGSAFHIEVGPYSLDGRDINRLRAAIAACDRATAWGDLGSA